jgi:flagellar hook-basal body complex protein FliE
MVDLRIAATAPAAVPPLREAGGVSAAGEKFGDALGRALAEVNGLQLEAQDAAHALAAGQPVDMAKTLVTIEKANISFQFALQVRNKLLEAYQEIMRMQV